MNVGLMFVHEPFSTDRQTEAKKKRINLIESKFGTKNVITYLIDLDKQYIRWPSNKLL